MIVGPRLAFKEAEDYVLCGNGNTIEVRETTNFTVKQRFLAFDNIIISGICRLKCGGYLCYGDRKLAIFNTKFETLTEINMHSWVSAVKILKNGAIVVLTASSILYKLSGDNFAVEEYLQLENFGILISGIIIGNEWENLSVFVGVFDYIKSFNPYKSTKAIKTLIGHTGMIFEFAEFMGILYSISDDRSLRAWNPQDGQQIASAFGHSSRPFAIEVSRKFGILTGGADQTVCIWELKDKSFNLLRRVEFDGGPIRSVCLIKDQLLIGSDTGSLFNVELNCKSTPMEVAISLENKEVNSFIRYPNQQFVFLTNNSELWIQSNGKHHLLCNEFGSKVKSLSKVPESDYFAVSTTSSVFIYDFTKERRITSLTPNYTACLTFWLGKYLFLTDSDQICHIYEFKNELIHIVDFEIGRKMSFVCSGCFYNNAIIVGTTRGTLLILDKFNLIQTIHGFHGKYAITDLKIIENRLCSIGKDGKFNYWTILDDMDLKLYSFSTKIECPFKLFLDESGNLSFISSFNAGKFTLFNAKTQLPIFEIYCGGRRRVSNYDMREKRLDFIVKSKVYSAKNNGLVVKDIGGSWHQSEFTSLEVCQLNEQKYLVLTAGNDTQITISEYCSITDEIKFKFKNKSHVGSILDMAICKDFLITIGGFAEMYLWRISKKDYTIHSLDKQRLEFDARLVSVNARLVNDSLFVAVISSFGTIKVFEYGMNGDLKIVMSVDFEGVSSYTKVYFTDDSSFGVVTTSGHLICYRLEANKIVEKSRTLIEKNSLTSLCVREDVVAVGSVSGQISVVSLKNKETILTKLAHASTVTDIQCSGSVEKQITQIISISLDRCVVVSQFDSSLNELTIIKTIVHCIYDPSRLRILENSDGVERKCIISGYGLESVSI